MHGQENERFEDRGKDPGKVADKAVELMPLSVNQKINDRIGDRQISLAKAFHSSGLLSEAGFQRVMATKR